MHNFCIAHICKHSLTGTQQAIVEKHQQCCNNTQASRQISAMKATGIPDSSRTPPPKGNLPTRHQPGPQPGLAVGPYTALTATTCRHHHAPSQWRSTDYVLTIITLMTIITGPSDGLQPTSSTVYCISITYYKFLMT